MNRVILLGHLYTELYIRLPENKIKCAVFILLTEEQWVDSKGTQKVKPNWHKVVVFKPKLVDWCEQYLTKGAKVIVEGQLNNRKHNNQAGQDSYASEVIIGSHYGYITPLSSLPADKQASVGYEEDDEDKVALQRASDQHPSSKAQFSSLPWEGR